MTSMVPVELGHTCKNQFIILDYRHLPLPPDEELAKLAEIICATAAADDLLIMQPSEVADVCLRIFGGDCREADFCGNGMVYIAAKVGGELERDYISVETASGVRTAVKTGSRWKIEIGPAFSIDDALLPGSEATLKKASIYGLVRAGEPHLVLFHANELQGFHLSHKDFEDYCRPLRGITNITGGINITMVFQISFRSLLIRTFERGVQRHTFSCGTGSVAAAAAVFDTPRDRGEFHICAAGGSHDVFYDNDHWFLVATPQPIASGVLDYKDSLGQGEIHFPLRSFLPYVG